MMTIHKLIPDHKILLRLEPEELAGIVLEYLNSLDENELYPQLLTEDHTVEKYPSKYQEDIKQALREAWVWLESEGLIARKRPGTHDGGLIFITRRGKRLQNAKAVKSYRKANLLPKKLLHPVIAQKIYHLFLLGDYDIAIFKAYKEVEVAVRDAGDYTKEDYGTALIRRAFDADNGPLADQNEPRSEREATAHLFAGAIGRYKNPHSHRIVPVTAEKTVGIIMFASHLLDIVDSRLPISGVSPTGL